MTKKIKTIKETKPSYIEKPYSNLYMRLTKADLFGFKKRCVHNKNRKVWQIIILILIALFFIYKYHNIISLLGSLILFYPSFWVLDFFAIFAGFECFD